MKQNRAHGILLFLSLLLTSMNVLAADQADYRVVPLPQSITAQKGTPFVLTAKTTIFCATSDEGVQRDARFLQQYIQESTGLKVSIADKRPAADVIILTTDKKAKATDEGYTLTVDKKRVVLTGSAAGIFHGVQTLRKSLPVATTTAVELPAVRISDTPRFGYRGLHLDCCRHFFTIDEVKTYLDMMALHNMNVFHWHLTDDQGWRIEIKRYPKLTTVGAWRSGTVIGNNSDVDDSIRYGGFYTQDQIRAVIRYAADRFITIIPEIEIPGHCLAALASYPELGCTGGPYEVGHKWGVSWNVLCVGNPKSIEFAKGVLDEVIDLFPSHLINIGGDETPTKRWDACPKDQALGVKSVQGYFTKQIEAYVRSKGRTIIGWDELLDHGASKAATILSWRGEGPGLKAAQLGHDVVMAPSTYCYFDFVQTPNTANEPCITYGKPITVEKLYSYEPVPDSIDAEAQQHVLGVQANLWSEHVPNFRVAQYQVLPRMAALAEVQWESRGEKDYEAFKARVDRLVKFYDRYDWQYAKILWPEIYNTTPRDYW